MPLSAGDKFGPYTLVSRLGEGGMGEVWKARDTRLDRTVAIKACKAAFSERFELEARAVAALNHPNICTLFDVGPNYLVMEYVDGQSLASLIPSSGMRLADALRIAVRIADALAAAHARGIVHRDLKPGNVMVTGEGVVKLLDFGLAAIDESTQPTGDSVATRTAFQSPKTAAGTILGTFSYMSPEQAEGRKVDTRSDIFSFGSMLYEMVTGQRAFRGETTISTLAAILNQEPKPPAALVAGLPADLERIIARCLRKDRDRRFQHASDLRVELQELSEAPAPAAPVSDAPAARPSRAIWFVSAAAAALIGVASGWLLHRPPPPFQGPTLTRATYDTGLTCDPALSPDGKLLAYASDREDKGFLNIWLQPVSAGDPVQLTHDDADDSEPSFSPDGSQVVYRSERDGGGIYTVSALGGEPRLIAHEGRGPRFSPDGTRVAYWTGKGGRSEAISGQGGRIFAVPAGGGEPRQLAAGILFASNPVWSPDGKTILFVGNRRIVDAQARAWFLTSASEDRPVEIRTDGIFENTAPFPSQWLKSNQILFAQRKFDAANVFRIGLDAASAKLIGKPERLTFGGGVENAPSMAANGTLALADLTWNFGLWSLPIDTRSARVTGEPVRLTASLTKETRPTLSEDGRKLAYLKELPGNNTAWVRDLVSGKQVRLVSQPKPWTPWISADGSMVVYPDYRDAQSPTFVVPSSGGVGRRINDTNAAGSWTRSGKLVHRRGSSQSGRYDVLDPKTREDRTLLKYARPTFQTTFSSDEKAISFMALTSSLTAKIVVAPATGAWPVPESEWIDVTDGSQWDDKPRWSPDGNLLYFTSERDGYRCIWAARLDPHTRHPIGAPFAVAHFHSSRRSMLNVALSELELAVGPDRIVFMQGEVTGNIWLAHLP
jgi:hypothetical protein